MTREDADMTSVARRREHDDSGEFSDASQDIEQNNSGNVSWAYYARFVLYVCDN